MAPLEGGIGSRFLLPNGAAAVTGAASGLGRDIALTFAEAGADVAVLDIDAAQLGDTAAAIEAIGQRCVSVAGDVSAREVVHNFVREAAAEFGHLDVMANIAGHAVTNSIVDTTEEEFDRIWSVHVKGTLWGTQAAIQVMRGRGGSVINMSSATADTPIAGLVSYASAKSAIAMISKIAAMEAGPEGVRVNTIAPGTVVTALTSRHARRPDGTVDQDALRAYLAARAEDVPLRITGEPSDVSLLALYLASRASRFMTGQTLRPNGGMAMP
jgi:3-oxoacyl-[acyl-carrier protein] reductase